MKTMDFYALYFVFSVATYFVVLVVSVFISIILGETFLPVHRCMSTVVLSHIHSFLLFLQGCMCNGLLKDYTRYNKLNNGNTPMY